MRDTPTHENFRDFRARYQHTYGWYVDEKYGKILVNITSVEEDYVKFMGPRGEAYQARVGANIMFEFTQIEHGWYMTPTRPVLLVRHPQRQWKRGICDENTRAMLPSGDNLYAHGVDFKILQECFAGTYEYKEGDFALSKYFACVGTCLYMKDSVVGSRKGNVLTLKSTFVHQELVDTIRRNGYPLEVRVEDN